MRIARQAGSEVKKLLQIFRQGENEGGWDEQLKGLVELERRCLTFREEVGCLSERHEVLTGEQEGHAEDSTRRLSEANFSMS